MGRPCKQGPPLSGRLLSLSRTCCIMGRQWSCLSHVPVMVRYLCDSLGGERRAVKVPSGKPYGQSEGGPPTSLSSLAVSETAV